MNVYAEKMKAKWGGLPIEFGRPVPIAEMDGRKFVHRQGLETAVARPTAYTATGAGAADRLALRRRLAGMTTAEQKGYALLLRYRLEQARRTAR